MSSASAFSACSFPANSRAFSFSTRAASRATTASRTIFRLSCARSSCVREVAPEPAEGIIAGRSGFRFSRSDFDKNSIFRGAVSSSEEDDDSSSLSSDESAGLLALNVAVERPVEGAAGTGVRSLFATERVCTFTRVEGGAAVDGWLEILAISAFRFAMCSASSSSLELLSSELLSSELLSSPGAIIWAWMARLLGGDSGAAGAGTSLCTVSCTATATDGGSPVPFNAFPVLSEDAPRPPPHPGFFPLRYTDMGIRSVPT